MKIIGHVHDSYRAQRQGSFVLSDPTSGRMQPASRPVSRIARHEIDQNTRLHTNMAKLMGAVEETWQQLGLQVVLGWDGWELGRWGQRSGGLGGAAATGRVTEGWEKMYRTRTPVVSNVCGPYRALCGSFESFQ